MMAMRLRSYLSFTFVAVFSGCSQGYTMSPMTCDIFQPGKMAEASPGIYLNYEVDGEETSERSAVVFLHGFGASLRNWDDIRPLLPGTTRRYFVDLKGCGFSAKPDDTSYSVADHADLILGFLDKLDLRSVVLVGHSYGGAVSLVLVQRLQDRGEGSRLRGLVLIDSAGYTDNSTYPLNFLSTPFVGSAIVNLVPPRVQVRETLERAFFDSSKIRPVNMARYACQYERPGYRRSLLRSAQQAVPKDSSAFQDRFLEVPVETLIIWSANDTMIPLAHGQRFHSVLPKSSLSVIERCGHLPHEECPERTAMLVAEYLQGVG